MKSIILIISQDKEILFKRPREIVIQGTQNRIMELLGTQDKNFIFTFFGETKTSEISLLDPQIDFDIIYYLCISVLENFNNTGKEVNNVKGYRRSD